MSRPAAAQNNSKENGMDADGRERKVYKLFEKTGNINYFLLYRELEKDD